MKILVTGATGYLGGNFIKYLLKNRQSDINISALMRTELHSWRQDEISIIKGDLTVPVISAASIIAKVSRDKQMQDLDTRYPEYGFAKHKGYGTKEHLLALSKYGKVKGVHRYSFAPVRDIN